MATDSEDKVEILITAEGTAEAAKGLASVTAELEKQKRVTDMVNATEQDLKRRIRIDLLKQEAKEVNNVGAAFRTVASNAAPANDVVQKATFQFGQFRAATAASAALVGNLGRSFVSIVPQAGGLISAVQSSGMAMSQFLGVLGGGPGILLGGVVAAVGLIATYFAKSAEEADKLAEATKKNAEELKEYLRTISDLREQIGTRFATAESEAKYQRDFAAGTLTSKQYAVERRLAKELYAQLPSIQKRIEAAKLEGRTEDLRQLRTTEDKALAAPFRGEDARKFEQLAREREAEEAKTADALRMMKHAEGAADADEDARKTAKAEGDKEAAARAARAEERAKTLEHIEELEKVSRERMAALDSEQAGLQLRQRFDEIDQITAKRKHAHAQETADSKKASEEKARIEVQHDRALQERNKAFTDAAMNAGQIGATTTLKMFSELVKGHKLAIGAVLEGIGDQMVAEGTRVLFQAAAMAFFPPTAPFAGGLAAVGAAEIAAGMGLGAGGARAEGGSSYAGGGGAGGGKTANYADPYGDTARYGSNSGGGPTIINLNFPTVLSPTAADGARMNSALRQAARVYGQP